MDSLRIFFSYSTDDKTIVGVLKDSLESYGFEVFLAHDDIEPCKEWEDEIMENLKMCDIFIPLLTDSFRNSKWTDQETGIAVATNKFIIPLQVDFPPYGFIGSIQSLKVDKSPLKKDSIWREQYLKNYLPHEIYKIITKEPRFEDFLINDFITEFRSVGSFLSANEKVKSLEKIHNFKPEQVRQIFIATKENRQIHEAFEAQEILKKFFEKYKGY